MEYNQLKASIAAVIKTNNRKEITGQLLQNVLFQMTNVIGENLQLAGFATPLTDPHEPDQNVFYVTDQGGVYPHFDNLTVDDGLTFLMWKNGEWTSHTVGVVTQEWVDSHYVSIEFFRSLFRAYDSAGLEILPNNNPEEALPTVVDNIKAMVGFWTEQYISALGQQTGGGGGGGATSLDELSDVFLTNPSLGQALVFTITPDHPEGIWVNQTIQAGTDMATVWAALAGNTTQQINISHLTDALADYATKTYVDQNFITVAYFDRLFRAYNGNTLVSHNDVTSTIDNIKAMFGFWTEQYLSALGNNSGGGGQLLALSNMADVTISGTPSDGQVLAYSSSLGKWTNTSGGTVDMNTVWTALADNTTTQQIALSHLTTALSGYLPLTGGTLTGQGNSYENVLNVINNNSTYGISIAKISYLHGYGTFLATSSTASDRYILHCCSGITGVGGQNAISRFIVRSNGNVGIGIDNPSYLLVVNGTAVASKFMESRGAYNYWVAVGVKVNNHFYQADGDGVVDIGNISGGGGGGIADPVQYLPFTSIYSGNSGYVGRGSYSNDDIQLTSYNGGVGLGVLGQDNILYINTSKNCGIGTMSPSYKLHVYGTIYATGAITALSDMRDKMVVENITNINLGMIANAPVFTYHWKDKKEDSDLHIGSSAQYWKTVLPETVLTAKDEKGTLSMQYGVAALVSSIIIARKVANHEIRIGKMEKWMKKWAEENDE